MLKVFIGYDHAEAIAFNTLAHSIWREASRPVSITPLRLNQLPLTRERNPKQSTEFSFSRFLVPYLCDYKGWALFLDCDMLFRDDIAKLFNEHDPKYAVQVVKHPDYKSSVKEKFLGNTQTNYPKKNWSSVMLFNNDRCRSLTPQYVNFVSGLDLHRFNWLLNEEVGELSPKWNYLVGENTYQTPDVEPGNVHFTLGTPCFPEYSDCEYSEEWYECRNDMMNVGGSNV